MRAALEYVRSYIILEATGYQEAVRLFDQHEGKIDLLVTDVSMPSRTGVDLARTLLQKKPSLKVLFTSGYVGAGLLRASGDMFQAHHFLPKPFRAGTFLKAVRESLESRDD